MKKLFSGIGSKIIFPYLLLTLIVAGIGAFIVVNLVTGTLHERFNNQLLDAGRVVAESMVGYETDRLAILRQVTLTEGVPEGLANQDIEALDALIPQIIVNSPADAVMLLDKNGRNLYSWERFTNFETEAAHDALSQVEEVQFVLSGLTDDYGNKRAMLVDTASGYMLFTIGPVILDDAIIGAAMVGTAVRQMSVGLTESAVARVTLYGKDGQVIATTLGDGRETIFDVVEESPEQYAAVVNLLAESPSRYQVVSETAETSVPLRRLEVLNQDYQLAFGDWRLRNESFGLFSVALPSNFIVNAAATSRSLLNVVFTIATVLVITIGFMVARSIARPLNRLVDVTSDVTEGDLNQRTGISRHDEIGTLALSFDTMTERLDERNQQLVAQKSELAAILHSIADGVIVLDNKNNIVNSNPAAEKMIIDLTGEFSPASLQKLLESSSTNSLIKKGEYTQRYDMNDRVLSASSAYVKTPEGSQIGKVMVMRDITRTVDAENRKDDFITSMSHELRSPLTVVKAYTELLLGLAGDQLDERQSTCLEKIAKGSSELDAHIQKMINISEIQAGTLSLKQDEISFTDLIRELSDEWRNMIEAKGIFFVVQISESILPVMADTSRLRWAISNLLENALVYTPESGSIQCTVGHDMNHVYLEVADSGVGIANGDQPFVFERFFRAKNDVNYQKRGIGLGLYITKEIIELHGGCITMNSKVGVGSTFTCELPLMVETTVIKESV